MSCMQNCKAEESSFSNPLTMSHGSGQWRPLTLMATTSKSHRGAGATMLPVPARWHCPIRGTDMQSGPALLHEKSYPRVGFSLLFSQRIGSPHHRSPLLSDAF